MDFLVRIASNLGRISQLEIDSEAELLIAKHGKNALFVAWGNVERSQWAKGNSNVPQRAARVYKAVRRLQRHP